MTDKILVVEDEPSIGLICRRVLSMAGYDVEVVADGLEAQNKIQENSYSIIILDLRLPNLDGKKLFLWIKLTFPGLEEKVIFMTGSTASEQTSLFLEESGRPVLMKPFTPNELLNIVKQYGLTGDN